MMSPIFCRSTFEPSTDGGGRKCPKKPRSTPRTEKLASRLRDQAAMTALDKERLSKASDFNIHNNCLSPHAHLFFYLINLS
jgi:hypothetical protein